LKSELLCCSPLPTWTGNSLVERGLRDRMNSVAIGLRSRECYNSLQIDLPVEPSAPGAGKIRFGLFEVDFSRGELCKRGRKVVLQEQPFQVLGLLLDHPGEVVTREELKQALWPSDTFIEFDQGLNKAK
jgi:DNA-binding response OmpR family regulator